MCEGINRYPHTNIMPNEPKPKPEPETKKERIKKLLGKRTDEGYKPEEKEDVELRGD